MSVTSDNHIKDQRAGNNTSNQETLNRTGFIYDSDSIGSQGHVWFTNGYCMQWGQLDSTDEHPTVTFVVPFTSFYGAVGFVSEFNNQGGGEAIALSGRKDDGASLSVYWPTTGVEFHCYESNEDATSGIGKINWFAWGIAANDD